jgi:acetyltransferase
MESGPVTSKEPITVRPLRATDTALDAEFVRHLSVDARRLRFFCGVRELSEAELKLLCDLDGQKAMAFVATIQKDGRETAIGVSRYAPSLKDGEREMALAVADDWQHQGVGELLLSRLIDYAKSHGVKLLYSVELADNHMMRELARTLGMHARRDPQDPHQVIYSLEL